MLSFTLRLIIEWKIQQQQQHVAYNDDNKQSYDKNIKKSIEIGKESDLTLFYYWVNVLYAIQCILC